MLILKVIWKLLLVPVWIVAVIVTAFVSLAVNILGLARGVAGFFLTLLLIGTIIRYQDITQTVFLIAMIGIGYMILFVGVSVELAFEMFRDRIKTIIFA